MTVPVNLEPALETVWTTGQPTARETLIEHEGNPQPENKKEKALKDRHGTPRMVTAPDG
jgi:hypothetical protein